MTEYLAMTKYDAIVVGAGHNGLVCAAYLAKAGQSVLVLEAGAQVGGAAVTREFAPGCRVSAGAHILHMMQPKILSDLGISLDLAARDLSTIALDKAGAHITIGQDAISGNVSAEDINAYPAFKKRLKKYASTLAPLLLKKPPRLVNGDRSDSITLMKMGWDLRFGLGKEPMRDFLRVVGMNIFDELQECFESDLLKGALSLDAVLGTHMGPRTPGTILSYLYRLTGELHGAKSALALPKGGLGQVTSALADAARSAGAEIRTNTSVAKILVDGDRVSGVLLKTGETISAQTVISNADPKTTFLNLVGGPHLEAGFAHRVNNIRMRGDAAKLHLALSELPNFKNIDETALGQRLVIAPDMKYVERAFDHSKYGEFSEQPALEITIPSLHDGELAKEGHVLSAIVQYAPYHLKQGWEAGKHMLLVRAIDILSDYAPNIRDSVTHAELLSPEDLEREFGMTGGHWHHGEFATDQILMMRPTYGAAQYNTPVPGLYLCGAGSHPGGGVTGAPGHNAAQAVLAGESA